MLTCSSSPYLAFVSSLSGGITRDSIALRSSRNSVMETYIISYELGHFVSLYESCTLAICQLIKIVWLGYASLQ